MEKQIVKANFLFVELQKLECTKCTKTGTKWICLTISQHF